jgi:hypothetical protein
MMGSAIATCVGTAAGAAALLLYGWSLPWWLASLVIAQFTVPVWLLVLLPLVIWLPPTSRLWHPFFAVVLGALAGALILAICLFIWSREIYLVLIYVPFGALIGGVTALVGSLTRRQFYDAKA